MSHTALLHVLSSVLPHIFEVPCVAHKLLTDGRCRASGRFNMYGICQCHAPAERNSVKYSVFHTVFVMKFCQIFRFGHPNPGKRSTRKMSAKFHAKFRATFGRENGNIFTQHFCSVAVLKSEAWAVRYSLDVPSIIHG